MNPLRQKENHMKRFEDGTYHWQDLWLHYDNIKTQYGLTSCDILKQLSVDRKFSYLQYLGKSGFHSTPAKRQGTQGKELRDILIANVHKVDWLPSIATYHDKLDEMQISHHNGISVHMPNMNNDHPELDITINLDESRKYNKEELTIMYTIDNIVPKIININYSRYLANANKLYAECYL